MTTWITVVCDSPRHARSKVAKVAFYQRNDPTLTGNDKWRRARPLRPRAIKRRANRVWKAGFQPDIGDILGPDLMPQQCKLCGARLTPWADDVLFPVLNQLAAQGESQISICELNLLVSKQLKG